MPKKRVNGQPGGGAHWTDGLELQMMTSATLIEALYDAVEEWLGARSKSSLAELNEEDCRTD